MKARSTMLLTAALLAAPIVAQAAPATFFRYRTMTSTLAQCMARAQASHSRAGSTSVNLGDDSVGGTLGPSRGVIVCIPGKDLLFIYAAGDNAGHARLFLNALNGGF